MQYLLAAVLALSLCGAVEGQVRRGCGLSTDILIVLDSSGSMQDQFQRGGNWDAVTEFLSMVILNLGRSVENDFGDSVDQLRFALIQYNNVPVVTFDLNDFLLYTDVAQAVATAQNLRGPSNLTAALEAVESFLVVRNSIDIRNTIVIIASDWVNIDARERDRMSAKAIDLRRRYDVGIITIATLGYSGDLAPGMVGDIFIANEDLTRLRDNIRQIIRDICEGTPAGPTPRGPFCERDVALVMDASDSLTDARDFENLKRFVLDVAGNLRDGSRSTGFVVVTFSNTARVSVPYQRYSEAFVRAVTGITQQRGLTNIASGLRTARLALTNTTRARYIILFSDGVNTLGRLSNLINEAQTTLSAGIQIISVGVTRTIDLATLDLIVGDGNIDSHSLFSPDFSSSLFSNINLVTRVTEACPVRALPCQPTPADIVVAFDSSGSIVDKGAQNWQKMKDFVVVLIQRLKEAYPGSQIGAIVFSTEATTVSRLTTDTNRVINAIRPLMHENGYTNHAATFDLARQLLNTGGRNTNKYLVLVTDGTPTRQRQDTIPAANRLKQSASIISVGVTNSIDINQLNRISSTPSNRFVRTTPDFDTLNLPATIAGIVEAADNCVRRCPTADVMMVVDASGSIEETGSGNFLLLREFAASVAENLARLYPQIRLGLVTFSETAFVISPISRFSTITRFARIVRSARFIGGQTNLADAIVEATNSLRAERNTNMPQILVITDGTPTQNLGREQAAVTAARLANIEVSAIGVTRSVTEQTFLRMFNNDRRRFFISRDFSITGLPTNFIRTTGVRCQSEPPRGETPDAPCDGEPEIVFVLDSSGSIEETIPNNWQNAQELVVQAIDAFHTRNPSSRFGLVIFSTRSRTEFDLTGDKSFAIGITRIASFDRGRTNTASGLERGVTLLNSQSRPDARKILILITDGETNEGAMNEEQIAARARSQGITIISVGIGASTTNYTLLDRISDRRAIRALSFTALRQEIIRIVNTTCNTGGVQIPVNRFTEPPRFPRFPNFVTTDNNQNRLRPLPVICAGYIVLAMDISDRLHWTTTWDGGFSGLKALAVRIIDYILAEFPSMQIAIVTYSSQATVRTFYNDNRDTIVGYIQGLTKDLDYNSNMSLPYCKAKEVFDQTNAASKNFLVITDGTDHPANLNLLRSKRQQLADSGNTFMAAVVVSNHPKPENLPSLTFLAPRYDFQISTIKSFINDGCEENNNLSPDINNNNNYPYQEPYDNNYYNNNNDYNSYRRSSNNGNNNNNNQGFINYPTQRYTPPTEKPPTTRPTPQRPVIAPLVQGDESSNVGSREDVGITDCARQVVFVIDSSGSIKYRNDHNWDHVRTFLTSVVQMYNSSVPQVKFGAVLFSDDAKVAFHLSMNSNFINAQLRNLEYLDKGTNIAAGIRLAREEVIKYERGLPALLVLLTDGDPTKEKDRTEFEARTAAHWGIDIRVVGVTSSPNPDLLREIAGEDEEKVMKVDDFVDLDDHVDELVQSMCPPTQQ